MTKQYASPLREDFFLPFSKVLILILRDENGVTSYIETENYFFSETIYLKRTGDFAHVIACAGDNTRVILSQSP